MANAKFGPLLESCIESMEAESDITDVSKAALRATGDDIDDGRLPVSVKLKNDPPAPGEPWTSYRSRVLARLGPLRDRLSATYGIDIEILTSANALAMRADVDQLRHAVQEADVELLELDPVVQATSLHTAKEDLRFAKFQTGYPGACGAGVTVAVLDSGVDAAHPSLEVADAVSTCGEECAVPGEHGTHCAGIIGSTDDEYRGLAPGVRLIDVKVLRANGKGTHTNITRGIDEALDRGADLISMSISFNHLPRWSPGGHGWGCPDGNCTLCMAVENASRLDQTLVIAAAGNEHARARELIDNGYDGVYDTELTCPGHAPEAITVAAVTKGIHAVADFSSWGPAAYGPGKPTLAAPGVDITSCVPVPRDDTGKPLASPSRAQLFGASSGTSMATPLIAGVAALLIEKYKAVGIAWAPESIKAHLVAIASAIDDATQEAVGSGVLDLSRLAWDNSEGSWKCN